MDQTSTIAADSTVRSQDSSNSTESKETKVSKISDSTTRSSKDSSKPESCLESKHSKDALIDTSSRSQAQRHHHHHHHQNAMAQQQAAMQQHQQQQQQRAKMQETKDDFNVLMFTSCGQLLLGVVLVVFGVLVLIHGAALGGTGAGLWAGASALVAGALGVVATLSSPAGYSRSRFSSAHLASSLIALALSNMAVITAFTAVFRDSQKTPPDVTLLTLPDEENIEEGWAGLLASLGLLLSSVLELIVSGYTCVILAPRTCDCLRPEDDVIEQVTIDGKTLKTRNMVQQWVIAQNHGPKNQPIYVVQPVVSMHPIMQTPYGMQPAGAPPPPMPGKYAAAGFLPPGAATPTAYGPAAIHVAYPTSRPPSQQQIMRGKHHQKKRRHSSEQLDGGDHSYQQRQRRSSANSQQNRPHSRSSPDSRHSSGGRKPPAMASIGEDQLQKDLARTYTGLDKRISEEFISIAMDPERKSKASSHHGSDISAMNK